MNPLHNKNQRNKTENPVVVLKYREKLCCIFMHEKARSILFFLM